jgi:TetR/AcrR family transcriptional repressor of nem operon
MRNDRMCLCGMFAAEYATLPAPMQEELRSFFDANEAWLATVLEGGRRAGELAFQGPSRDRARIMLGTLEGAMLIARAYADDGRFRPVADHLLKELVPPAPRQGI